MQERIDPFVHSISPNCMEKFVFTCSDLIQDIIARKRPNWRSDVVNGIPVLVDGKRLMKHQLTWFNVSCGTGDFQEKVIEHIINVLDQINPNGASFFNQTVLLYTIIEYFMISVADMTAPQARYYLCNGGENMKNSAMELLEKKFERSIVLHFIFYFFVGVVCTGI